jgi:hypothetical protein
MSPLLSVPAMVQFTGTFQGPLPAKPASHSSTRTPAHRRYATKSPAIVDFATRRRLPAIYEAREFVESGGLISYGSSLFIIQRRVAEYSDRIFKGAKPTDLRNPRTPSWGSTFRSMHRSITVVVRLDLDLQALAGRIAHRSRACSHFAPMAYSKVFWILSAVKRSHRAICHLGKKRKMKLVDVEMQNVEFFRELTHPVIRKPHSPIRTRASRPDKARLRFKPLRADWVNGRGTGARTHSSRPGPARDGAVGRRHSRWQRAIALATMRRSGDAWSIEGHSGEHRKGRGDDSLRRCRTGVLLNLTSAAALDAREFVSASQLVALSYFGTIRLFSDEF